MRKGLAVSPGIAVGTAYCIHEIYVNPDTKRLADQEVTAELARYEAARDKVANELRNLQRKVETQVGQEESLIFQTHQSILRDVAFTKKVREWIVEDRLEAQAALQRLMDEYERIFSKTKDDYIRERLTDIRDVVIRLTAHLSDILVAEVSPLQGPLIICTDELLPSQAVALGDTEVKGIVTQRGSQTSHAAIIARSRGIPAVSGVSGLLRHVKSGDTIVVDGRDGLVKVNPDAETLSAYRKLEREFFDLRDQLAENRDQPALTADGEPLRLMANINHAADANAAKAMGASGVGLYRTEYLYLTHESVPDELEQYSSYCEIIDASPDHQVTIRTLDIGGDKTIPYLGRNHQEANPFMGWRSIRLSFEHPDFFETQIRAVLRAAAYANKLGGQVKLMFPMITTLEEIRRVRSIVKRACRKLGQEGAEFAEVPIGLMLEVPAAAVAIELMLDSVDFVSIGSNDLVQYLMAADRDNPKVSHLCQPLSPPVLRVLSNIIKSCNAVGKPVTLCGEMAGQPRAFVLLLGMGLRQFSMSPAFVPTTKQLAAKITLQTAEKIFEQCLRLKTTTNVKRFMAEQMREIAPDLAIFDSN